MAHTKIIQVDFDGVLHSYTSGWKGADVVSDPPNIGAIEWLGQMLDDERFDVCIYSSRSKEPSGIIAMLTWLAKHGLNKDSGARLRFPTQKEAAFLTIDDRAFVFRGTFPGPDTVATFQPWKSSK